MLGLFERIGEGLEMVGLAVEGAMVNATCAAKNIGTDISVAAKCKAIDREMKNSKKSTVEEQESDIQKLISQALAGDLESSKKLGDVIDKGLTFSAENASEEDIQKAKEALSVIEHLSCVLNNSRLKLAQAIDSTTPIMQSESRLREMAQSGKPVTGKDIVSGFTQPQTANPVDINQQNPIPAEA